MGREASFELNCSDFSGSVTDFIKILNSLGWSYYDSLVLYYRDTEHGVTLLAADISEILIIPNINRKTLDDDHDSMTDVSWYAERLFQKLLWYDCGMTNFQFEEYED